MASTYEKIANYTTTGSTANYTFTSIPSTYTDLILVGSTKLTSGGAANDYIQFNGDTSMTYSWNVVYGTGSSTGAYRRDTSYSVNYIAIDDTTSTEFNTINVNIMSYANSSVYKTLLHRYGAYNSTTGLAVGLWRNTAAITSIKVNAGGVGTWAAGTTFGLYGVKSA